MPVGLCIRIHTPLNGQENNLPSWASSLTVATDPFGTVFGNGPDGEQLADANYWTIRVSLPNWLGWSAAQAAAARTPSTTGPAVTTMSPTRPVGPCVSSRKGFLPSYPPTSHAATIAGVQPPRPVPSCRAEHTSPTTATVGGTVRASGPSCRAIGNIKRWRGRPGNRAHRLAVPRTALRAQLVHPMGFDGKAIEQFEGFLGQG